MIFRVEDIKNVCMVLSKVSSPNVSSVISQVIRLTTNNKKLNFLISDSSFSFTANLDCNGEDIDAVVEATPFLNLISRVTTETVSLSVTDKCLVIKANGTYKLPLIYKDDKLISVKEMPITTVVNTWNMSGDDLSTVETYNLNICMNSQITDPLQRYSYIDKFGCVSFGTRACINNFESEMPVKILAPNFLVKTFPLYKGKDVTVSFGYESITEDFNQPRISFEVDTYKCVYALPFTDEQLNEFPVDAIRALGQETYSYSVVLSTKELIGAIMRLSVFLEADGVKCAKFKFMPDRIEIEAKNNKEIIIYDEKVEGLSCYEVMIDLVDLKQSIDQKNNFTTLHFGNDNSISVVYGSICNVISLIEE